MAWSLVIQGPPVTVASGNITFITDPGGVAGDIDVACVAARSSAVFSMSSGWTQIAQESLGDTVLTADGRASAFMAWRFRPSGAWVAPVFTRTGGDVGYGRIIVYRQTTAGVVAALDVVSQRTGTAPASASSTAPSLTTVNGAMLVAMVAMGDNAPAFQFDAVTDPATDSGIGDTTGSPVTGTWRRQSGTSTTTGADTSLSIAHALKSGDGATGQFSVLNSPNAVGTMIVAAFKTVPAPATSSGKFFQMF